MATQAKLKGNARYLAKFRSITARIPLNQADALQAAADLDGVGLSTYLVRAAAARAGIADEADRVHISISAASLEPYRLEGESAGQTAARLLRLGIQAAKQD